MPEATSCDLGRLTIFAYTVEPLAPLYRAVLRLFLEAKNRYRIQFRPDEVAAELRWDTQDVERALDQLVQWGNLRRSHDTGRVGTLADFRRRHLIYQLTPAGEAAERAVGEVVAALERSGSLQRVMLGTILRNLVGIREELAQGEPRPERLFEHLFNLTEQFRALTENASAFLARLHEAIDQGEVHVELDAQVRAAAERSQAARAGLDREREILHEALLSWSRDLVELRLDDAAFSGLQDRIEEIAASGPDRLAAAVEAAAIPLRDALVRSRTEFQSETAAVVAEREATAEERRQVAEARELGPEPPRTRAAARAGRSGAPLYLLCDFAPHLGDLEQAGLEAAALEAAGLLDAWITPDGGLLSADTLDTWLVPVFREFAGPTLRDVLVPAAGHGVEPEVLDAVLRSIDLGNLGNGLQSVDAQGRFRLGVLQGAWTKPVAEHVGAGAREAARQRRLAELDARLETLAERLELRRAELAERDDERARAVARLRTIMDAGWLPLVLSSSPEPEAAWSLTLALDLAREIERETRDVDLGQDAADRRAKRLWERFQILQADLGGDYQPRLDPDDELLLVRVAFNGRDHDVKGLLDALREDAEVRRTLLADHERELLWRTVSGEVGDHLRNRLRQARALVGEKAVALHLPLFAELYRDPSLEGVAAVRMVWHGHRGHPDHGA
jgi:DNA-binding MarR family transcriptional regulator